MKKCSFFIDGFNLYHAIISLRLDWAKWMNFRALAEYAIEPDEEVSDIFFFTALPTWDQPKVERLQTLIKAQRSVGVKIILGQFQLVHKKCRKCGQTYETFEEKKTDVNIAIRLFQLALEERYDKAYILSGDSDIVPSIKSVKHSFPRKEFGVIIPAGRKAKQLQKACDSCLKLTPAHYKKFRFPNVVTTKDQKNIFCPKSWR